MEEFATTEVAKLDLLFDLVLFADHDIFRLDVPVGDVPDLVAVVDCRDQAPEVLLYSFFGEAELSLIEASKECSTSAVVHDEVNFATLPIIDDFSQFYNISVVHPGQTLQFLPHLSLRRERAPCGLGNELLPQDDLDGVGLASLRICALFHLAVAATPQGPSKLILIDPLHSVG